MGNRKGCPVGVDSFTFVLACLQVHGIANLVKVREIVMYIDVIDTGAAVPTIYSRDLSRSACHHPDLVLVGL